MTQGTLCTASLKLRSNGLFAGKIRDPKHEIRGKFTSLKTLVVSFTLLSKPSTTPADMVPLASNQLSISCRCLRNVGRLAASRPLR
jgi:hypothetical protein